MAGYEAIADVGDTLVAVLRAGMGDLAGDDEIVLASPDGLDADDGVRLSVYLYDVSEDAHRANEPPPADAAAARGAPLVLELSYLLTAHPTAADDPGSPESKDHHRILGKAMRTLQDNAIISGSRLEGSLAGDERLHVSIDRGATDRVIDVWTTFQETPYRPSVAYVVTPVTIDSTRERATTPVVDAQVDHHVRTGREERGDR